ncbi:MAG: hypothetical protein ACLTTJ_05045 [Blautia sp.]
MEKVLLNMKAISKTFGSVQALKEVSLDLYAGEVLALMGRKRSRKIYTDEYSQWLPSAYKR